MSKPLENTVAGYRALPEDILEKRRSEAVKEAEKAKVSFGRMMGDQTKSTIWTLMAAAATFPVAAVVSMSKSFKDMAEHVKTHGGLRDDYLNQGVGRGIIHASIATTIVTSATAIATSVYYFARSKQHARETANAKLMKINTAVLQKQTLAAGETPSIGLHGDGATLNEREHRKLEQQPTEALQAKRERMEKQYDKPGFGGPAGFILALFNAAGTAAITAFGMDKILPKVPVSPKLSDSTAIIHYKESSQGLFEETGRSVVEETKKNSLSDKSRAWQIGASVLAFVGVGYASVKATRAQDRLEAEKTLNSIDKILHEREIAKNKGAIKLESLDSSDLSAYRDGQKSQGQAVGQFSQSAVQNAQSQQASLGV